MKTKNLNSLTLNKKMISNFKMNTITGRGSEMSACCVVQSYGTCEKEPLDTRGCPHD